MALDTDDIDQTLCTQCGTETDEMYQFDTNGDGLVDVIWCVQCGALYVRDRTDVKTSMWIPPTKRTQVTPI